MKKIILILFALVSLTMAQNNNEMPPEAAKFYNSGNKQLKSGNYEGAIQDYDKALETSKDYRIFYQKGVSLKKIRKFDDAVEAFKASLENNPDFDLAYNGLGGIYFAQGKYDLAVEAFKKFEEKTPKDKLKKKAKQYIARSYTKLGEKAKGNNNYKKAVEYLTEAVSNANYDAAYLLLAESYVELAKYNEALDAATKALKYRKSISKGGPYYYEGMAYKGLDQKDKAIAAFKKGKSDKKYKKLCEYELKLLK